MKKQSAWNRVSDKEMGWTAKQKAWLEAMERMLEHTPGENARALLLFAVDDGLTIVGSCCQRCNDALIAFASEVCEEDHRMELH